jgi:SulP family sulfate permease
MELIIAGFIGGLRTVFGIAALALLIMPASLNDQGHLLFSLMIGAMVAGIIVTKWSDFKNIISQPQDGPAVLISIFALVVLAKNPSQELMIEIILAAVAIASIFTGCIFYSLGHWKLGRIVRFIPFPVIGGFLAGSGLLITLSGLSVLANHKISIIHLGNLLESFNRVGGPLLFTGVLISIMLLKIPPRFKSKLVFPFILIASAVVLNLIFIWQQIPIEELQREGWLLTPKGGNSGSSSIYFWFDIPAKAWLFILENALTFFAITIVSIVAFLLNLSGLEVASNSEFDFNKELKVVGIANIVGGALGGGVNFPALSASLLGKQMKVHSRWIGYISYSLIFVFLIVGPAVLEYVPKPILGALLLCMGVSLLDEWLIKGFKKFSRIDYLIIFSITLIMSIIGYLSGVAVGLMLCLTFFVWNYSQLKIITLELNDVDFRSSVDRSQAVVALLDQYGHQIKYLKIDGFLFFGSVYSIYERIQLLSKSGVNTFILDMSKVKAIDSSALSVINKIDLFCKENSCEILISRLKSSLKDQITLKNATPLNFQFFSDRDLCIESAENLLIGKYLESPQEKTELDWESIVKPSESEGSIEQFKSFFTKKTCSKGDYLIRQGDDGDELFIIGEGKFDVFILINDDESSSMRMRSMTTGSIFGEAVLYSNIHRIASVRAEEDSVVFALSKARLTDMENEFPYLANQLHRKIVSIMSQRLNTLLRLLSHLDP